MISTHKNDSYGRTVISESSATAIKFQEKLRKRATLPDGRELLKRFNPNQTKLYRQFYWVWYLKSNLYAPLQGSSSNRRLDVRESSNSDKIIVVLASTVRGVYNRCADTTFAVFARYCTTGNACNS
jgi:hypothetical protein